MHNCTDIRPEARVLSECALARHALSGLLEEAGWSVSQERAFGEPLPEPDLVLVWIALPLREVLSTLEALAVLLKLQRRQPRVMVMGEGAPDWFWYSLRQQLPVARFPNDMLFVGADAPVAHLRGMLAGRHDGVPYRQVLMHRVHQRGGGHSGADAPGGTDTALDNVRCSGYGVRPETQPGQKDGVSAPGDGPDKAGSDTRAGTAAPSAKDVGTEGPGGQGHAFRQTLSAGSRHDKA